MDHIVAGEGAGGAPDLMGVNTADAGHSNKTAKGMETVGEAADKQRNESGDDKGTGRLKKHTKTFPDLYAIQSQAIS
jgi:hypothetical protein